MAICLRTVSSRLKTINKFAPSHKHVGLSRLEIRLRPHKMMGSTCLEEVIRIKFL